MIRRVSGIIDHNGRPIYKLHEHFINSRDYGTPQSRHRWYFVGTKLSDMKSCDLDMTLPPMQEPPELDEYLGPVVDGLDNAARKPPGAHAQRMLKLTLAEIIEGGGDPFSSPYVVDLDASETWRSKKHIAHRVPCLTHSRAGGFWITNRGRYMTAQECLRVQGISRRATSGLPANFIRACVGNAMSVRIVSMLISSAFDLMKTLVEAPLTVAMPASIETARQRANQHYPGSQISQKPKKRQWSQKFSTSYFMIPFHRKTLIAMREDVRKGKSKLIDLTTRLHAENIEVVDNKKRRICQQEYVESPAILIGGNHPIDVEIKYDNGFGGNKPSQRIE